MPLLKIKQKYVKVTRKHLFLSIATAMWLFGLLTAMHTTPVYAAQTCDGGAATKVDNAVNVDPVKVCDNKEVSKGINGTCGGGDNSVKMAIDIGCKGIGNPIMDAVFAVIRFLTLGVSIVIIASTVFAGVQYTASRGDPNATASALKRISSNVGALVLFILTYAILNWLVPGMILK